MKKTMPISFRLPPEIKKALEKAAERDERSVSSLLEKITVNWLRYNGYLDN
jgi:hypothetical protein